MAAIRSSHSLLKLGFGQHILNGAAVGLGVGAVTTAISLAFGFTNGMAAATGAICVSIGDQPNPLTSKLKILPVALILACLSSLLIGVTVGHVVLQGLVVVAVSFMAGLLVGYGRQMLPVSVLTMLALVFTLGSPLQDLHEAMAHEALFALGGFGYMLVAFVTTYVTERSGRRIAVAECLREFARYLRTVAQFYDPAIPLPEVYRHVVEQQAALADHLQAARQQIFVGRQGNVAKRLAAILILQLDALDALVSAHADYAPLRGGAAGGSLPKLVAALVEDMAVDLDRLAGTLLRYGRPPSMPDRQAAFDRLGEEVARLGTDPNIDARSLRAARATRTKLGWVNDHLHRLPIVMRSQDSADALLRGIDLQAFLRPLSLSPRILSVQMHWTSPVLRHAIRLAAAMGVGYLLIALVPQLNHGNWILLTIAVVLRAQYGITRQRRHDRLIGNLIGCLISAILLKLAPAPVQLAAIPLAVGISHAYVRLNYLVASVAACVMAILSLHFLDPVTAPPILERLLDTVIGVAIVFLFSWLLPRWEYQEAPKLVASLMKGFTAYLRVALKREVNDHAYRLARKALLESLAAITESATRLAGEPRHVRATADELAALLSAAYGLAAQIVGVRVLLSHRQDEIDPAYADALLEQSRAIALGQLDLSTQLTDIPDLVDDGDKTADAEKALKLRCVELCADAVKLHEAAAGFRSLSPSGV